MNGTRRQWLASGAALLPGLAWGLAPNGPDAKRSPATAAGTQRPVWRFGVERRYAPFISQDGQGRNFGLSYDLLALIRPLLPAQVEELPPEPLPQLIQGVTEGRIDFISSVRATPERGQFLGFSHPYVKVPAVLVTRRGVAFPASLAQLAAARAPVAVGRGYALATHLRQQWPSLQVLELDDDEHCLAALLAGQVAAWGSDLASARYLWRSVSHEPLVMKESLGFSYDLSFAHARHRPDIGLALDQALSRLDSALWQGVLRRWMPGEDDADRPAYYQPAVQLSAAALLAGGVLAASSLWSTRRRRGSAEGEAIGAKADQGPGPGDPP